MATKKEKSKKHSRSNVKDAVEAGKDWRLTVMFDNDVMRAVLDEKEELPTSEQEYARIINRRLRESYGITKQK